MTFESQGVAGAGGGAEMGLDLMGVSDRNILNFYSEELRLGRFNAIPSGVIKSLKIAGLLTPGKRDIRLTEKAIKILGEIQK